MTHGYSWSGDYGYNGKAWYRKHFRVDAAYSGRKVFLNLRVSVKRASFTSTVPGSGDTKTELVHADLDITSYVNFSADNILAVKS